jgi:ABC-type uncharacterized transport system substrate-binding protein
MRLIGLAVVVALGLFHAPLTAEAQQAGKVWRIGVLTSGAKDAPTPGIAQLTRGLRDLGYVDGRNFVLEVRYAEGRTDRFAALATELVDLKVDVLVAVSTPGALAALQSVEVQELSEFERAFAEMMRERPDALLVTADGMHRLHQAWIVDFAARRRLPTMYQLKDYVEAGGLMSYGTSITEPWRRAATYVDKILKGAKPADLPVEQPTKFELVINLKTAKALGLTIPQSVLLQADQVIQ